MSQRTNRTERIPLRATPAEKLMITERAASAGLGISEWLRQQGMAAPKPQPAEKPAVASGDSRLSAYVARTPATLPMATRVRQAKSQLAREALAK